MNEATEGLIYFLKTLFWTATAASVVAILAVACTALGVKPNLANDCALQAGTIEQATKTIGKMTKAEAAAIDAQIELSRQYCSGTMPADVTNASKVVEAATAQMAAITGIAAAR